MAVSLFHISIRFLDFPLTRNTASTHHGNKTAEDSYSLPSEEKYLKISFDAKIGFVFTVPQYHMKQLRMRDITIHFRWIHPAGSLRV